MSEKHLRRLLELEPGNSDAGLALALVLIRQQKDEDAAGVLRGLLDREPRNFKGLVTLGKLQLKQGQTREAAVLLERAGQIDGKVPPLWNDLAAAYLALERPRDARGALQRSLALDPNQPEVSRRLAEMGG